MRLAEVNVVAHYDKFTFDGNVDLAIELHRKEWGHLADNPILTKDEVVDSMGYGGDINISHQCFFLH